MNRTHALPRNWSFLRAGRLFLLAMMLGGVLSPIRAVAQESGVELAVGESPTPAPQSSPTEFGRTVVMVLGGVSWRDWLALASQKSTSTPGFRKVLEEGALGAAYLQGGAGPGRRASVNAQISEPMLRAALTLASGQTPTARALPPEAASTLGLRERLPARFWNGEGGEAAVAFARRTDVVPQPGNLVNLGWGALLQAFPQPPADEENPRSLGALAETFHRAGGKTAALGGADTGVDLGTALPLREWALLACDHTGKVDAGDGTARLLAKDPAAPFGIRANRKAYGQLLDGLFSAGQTGLIAIEWGDIRRAAEYSRWCAPEVAAAHQQAALRSADAWLQMLVGGPGESTSPRLTAPRDRLVIVVVPELHAQSAQWLPIVYWRPSRGGQGAVLEREHGGEGPGAIGLENLHARLVVSQTGATSTLAPSLRESGGPQNATARIARLIALQSGLAWLEGAQKFAHAIWCLLFIVACALTLWALHLAKSTAAALWARRAWCAAMIFPWLLWLAGLCVQTTWSLGTGGADWKFVLALLLVACLMWFLIGATFNWFGGAKLQRVRLGIVWLILTAVALWLGGFVLPWNALLHLAPHELSERAARSGELWSLLLVSATLFALSGLTKTKAVPAAYQPVNLRETGSQCTLAPPRRVLNLRPAFIWSVAVVTLLWAWNWGRNDSAAVLGILAFGTMWVRMWLERAPRAERVRNRRIVLAIAVVAVLLIWQRGALGDLASSWPEWLLSWKATWRSASWNLALLALVALVWAFSFTDARQRLRAYLSPRYSLRAMLSASGVAALASLIAFGPAGPPLLATFTLGALAYEVLGTAQES